VKVTSSNQKLAEARASFKTKIVRKDQPGDAPDQPPAKIFNLVQYDSAVGKLHAYLSPDPKDGKKHPAIIWITGGDCNTIDGGCWKPQRPQNDQSARAFREAGIIMMFPSLRGGNNNPGIREGFFGEIDDVVSAFDYLSKQAYVDPNRIYLGGHSTGGTVALLTAEMTGKFRAIFSFGPVDRVFGYGPEYAPYDTSNQQEFQLRDPILWLSNITSPTFVFEGTQDGNLDSLERMQRESRNPRVQFFPVKGMNHFDLLHPLTGLLAQKILSDTGEKSNITILPGEWGQR
jgi:dipeptidyl aminopeptidase/acylaminoacyl peptidase